ncbi:TPA: hypothetical protein RFU61_002842 [Klebsiella pneumoniae subsp. pneumoniae]|uniref:hypothetical protein n=1 Tax=Klebsiella pneumoniae TaxID=573 RepID=UPI0010340962|nr:hypothetical protein [Klebsiella pneumoniae]HDS5695768.1 hypothetical protein [Klebsiella pneumoniae subsp. pneumoniae]HDT0221762.1 hypothetical protein [Klebsiella pneumoniae subsp. pneumoniae]HDU5154502.1 hypothetical protein [Klebsiella pneumoniae subsp. pneumoniae]HDU5366340.1 hypothetical protein [Klebsiella pneumoniae]
MKAFAFFIAALVSFGASAGGYTAYCGPYTIEARVGEMDMINGERVTSQKITNLGADGIKIDMGLMPAKDGNNYGFEYVRYPGTEKRFLNVQLLQASMDAPKIIGSFPCKKVAD